VLSEQIQIFIMKSLRQTHKCVHVLNKKPRDETCGAEDVQLHSFLTLALMALSGHFHSLVTLLLSLATE